MPDVPQITIIAKSHKDAGIQLGEKMKMQVHNALNADSNLRGKMVPWYNTAEGKKVFEELYKSNKEEFPDYMEELEGLAEGSQAELHELFMYSLSEEFSYLLKGEYAFVPDTHCSDYAVMEENTIHICHNEDGSYSSVGNMALADITIYKNDVKECHFVAAIYGGQIATNAFGWNYSGILFTMNYVKPLSYLNNGLSRMLVARKLLDAKTWEEAIETITMKRQMCGRNYQLMDAKTKKLLCIEVTTNGEYKTFQPSPNNPHFHANNYNILDIPMDVDESSVNRQARADELPKPKTIDESLAILGDTHNSEWPIYRGGVKRRYTLCTSIYDLNKSKITILLDNPKLKRIQCEYPIVID